jgi:hypothetical protein
MKPHVDETKFGWIRIEGKKYGHDVVIRLDGKVKKRKKKLSKAVYDTSHKLSLDEAKHIFEKGTSRIVIGSGQDGVLELSDEALRYFGKKGITVDIFPTPEAIKKWNDSKKSVIGLFHVRC